MQLSPLFLTQSRQHLPGQTVDARQIALASLHPIKVARASSLNFTVYVRLISTMYATPKTGGSSKLKIDQGVFDSRTCNRTVFTLFLCKVVPRVLSRARAALNGSAHLSRLGDQYIVDSFRLYKVLASAGSCHPEPQVMASDGRPASGNSANSPWT